MYESFPGKLTLHDGSIVGAVLTVGDDVLTISAEGITVGTWPLKYCRVARVDDATFQIAVDGEPTSFRPSEPLAFAQVAAQRFRASTLADRIDVIRAMPPAVDLTIESGHPPRGGPLDLPRVPVVLGVVVLAAVALVTISGLAGQEVGEAPALPASSETTLAGVVEEMGLSTMTVREFTVRWNVRAFQLGRPDLQVDNPSTEAYEHPIDETIRLTVEGSGGRLSGVAVAVDATGNDSQRQRAYQALEVAVAVAQPAWSRDQRRDLLAELGVSPSLEVAPGVVDRQVDDVEFVVSSVAGLTEITFQMGSVGEEGAEAG